MVGRGSVGSVFGWFGVRVPRASGGVRSSVLFVVLLFVVVLFVVGFLPFVPSRSPGVAGCENGAGGAGDQVETVARSARSGSGFGAG